MWNAIKSLIDSQSRMDVVHGPERKPKYPGVLEKRLVSYPPNSPIHRGPPHRLTDAQVDENFATFLAKKSERIRIFGALLTAYEVDIAPLLDASAPAKPVIDAVEKWMADYLPERKNLPPFESLVNAPNALFAASSRDGSEIVFSLAADYAIALGDAIILRKPKWFWGVDREPENSPKSVDGGMGHYRSIVLKTKARKNWPAAIADLEMSALGVIYHVRSRSFDMPHTSWWFDGVIAEEDYGPPDV
jgi:hypothetical protein